jgi:hypothetical protein
MRAEVSMKQGVRVLSLFLAAAWLGSVPGFRTPLSAQSSATGAVPRGKPIKPLTTEAKPESLVKPTQGGAPATNAAVPSQGQVAGAPASKPGFASVGFDVLATFKYEVPEDAPAAKDKASASTAASDPDSQIPANVKAFNGKKVAVKGFMLPLKVEGGLVTELLLMRDQSMCCFGTVPKINEWIAVKMGPAGIKPVMDQAVTLYGTLKVGAMRENGYLVGIYQMDGDKVDGPPGS